MTNTIDKTDVTIRKQYKQMQWLPKLKNREVRTKDKSKEEPIDIIELKVGDPMMLELKDPKEYHLLQTHLCFIDYDKFRSNQREICIDNP